MSKEDDEDDGESYLPKFDIIPIPHHGAVNLQVREKWVPILDSGGNVLISGDSVLGGGSYVSGTVLKYTDGAIAVDWGHRWQWEEVARREAVHECPDCGKPLKEVRTRETLGENTIITISFVITCKCPTGMKLINSLPSPSEEKKGPRLRCVEGNPEASKRKPKGKIKIVP